jgi:hypothetical protein
MQEQLYAQSTYSSSHRAEANIMGDITTMFGHINEKIQTLYAEALDTLADRLIRRFNL